MSNAAGAGARGGVWDPRGRLLRDAVHAVAGGVLLRFDLQPALAAEDADEAPDRVLLPTGELLNLGQTRALGPLHEGDYLVLLTALARNGLCCGLLGSLRRGGHFSALARALCVRFFRGLDGLGTLRRLPCLAGVRRLGCFAVGSSQGLEGLPDPGGGLRPELGELTVARNAVPDLDEAFGGGARGPAGAWRWGRVAWRGR